MKTEQQRIAIAEACGWYFMDDSWHYPNGANAITTPDYLNDLKAMHEAERTMGDPQLWVEYQSYLSDVMGHVGWIYHATAAQRAEAFLRTLNLWKP